MTAVVEICESNGAGQTITHGITHTNMGSIDSVNLDTDANPIYAGDRSYVKEQRMHVTSLGGSSKIKNLRVWRNGALGTNTTHVTNVRTSGYGGAFAYVTPSNAAVTGVDQAMPTSQPISANVGIGGSLTGEITAPGYSDYIAHQLITAVEDTIGADISLNYSYDEYL